MATAKVRTVRDGRRLLSLSDSGWTPDLAKMYVDQECQGVTVSALGRDFEIPDVSFLHQLPGLEEIRLLGRIRDDTAAFEISSARSLQVDTPCRTAIRFGAAVDLETLDLWWRPGVETVAELANLRELSIYGWEAPDFRILGEKPALEFLRVQLRRATAVTSAGLAGARALRTAWFYEGAITDTEELSALPQVEELAFRGTKVSSLDFVRACPRLRSLELENCGEIASLAPLADHPALASVAISGSTKIVDGDLSPLLAATLVDVALERGHPHYSHRPAEVRR